MRFIFDVSISYRIAKALAILEPSYEITTVGERFGDESIADEIFLPQLADEGRWVALTRDRGRKDGNWQLWRASGVTVFFLKKGWARMPFRQMAIELLKRWPDIVRQTETNPESTCFWLSTRGRIERI